MRPWPEFAVGVLLLDVAGWDVSTWLVAPACLLLICDDIVSYFSERKR